MKQVGSLQSCVRVAKARHGTIGAKYLSCMHVARSAHVQYTGIKVFWPCHICVPGTLELEGVQAYHFKSTSDHTNQLLLVIDAPDYSVIYSPLSWMTR